MRKLYMHTLDNKPAAFQSTEGSVVFEPWQVRDFATSLNQIRAEQRLSAEWDRKYGLEPGRFKYGYRLLYIPDEEVGS